MHTPIDSRLPTFEPELVARVERALQDAVRGDVRFDKLTRAIYATDASLYQISPTGAVLPRDVEDVVRTVQICTAHGIPIVARGGGTGIAGGALGWGVQIDFSRYMAEIRDFDPQQCTLRAQPGAVLDDVNAFVAPHGLFFAPDVATASRATIGGMIANNSCGAHSLHYGRTVDHVAELTVVLADGSVVNWEHHPFTDLPPTDARGLPGVASSSIDPVATTDSTEQRIRSVLGRVRSAYRDEVLARYPRVMRRNGGYALDRLCMSEEINPATIICGSEGTLGLVVEARLRLVPVPKHKALLVSHFRSVLDAVGATPQVLEHDPVAVELVDQLILSAGAPEIPDETRARFLEGVPPAILVTEFYDDDETRVQARVRALCDELQRHQVGYAHRVVLDSSTQTAVWNMRNRGFGLLMSRPGDRQPHEFIEDSSVPPTRLREYIRELSELLEQEGVDEVGYYAHASVGVIHVRPSLNLKQPADVAKLRRIAERTSALVLKYGGAFTGEHGDGIVRSEFLEAMYGPRIIGAFREVKDAFDPHNLLNPRKIVNPLPMTENLRYKPADTVTLPTFFDYGDHQGMRGLAGMCSGVGQCRQKLVGTMCPSYMATLDERHTTRARANALRIALERDGLLDGLDDPALHDAMDLCLSCKACKTECPTGVDMARLKAEWLAQTYKKSGVPRSVRFLTGIGENAKWGARFPRIANAIGNWSVTRALLEARYGVDRRVPLPRFASRPFTKWFAKHRPRGDTQHRVVYIPDTWMNYFWPEVGGAAVRLLEHAGYEVVVPRLLCCGRPQISKGLLDDAVRLATHNVEVLATYAYQNVPIVGSEPSCVSAFLDDYPLLLATDTARAVAEATRSVSTLLAERIADAPERWTWRGDASAALYHGHCHEKALVTTADSMTLLNAPSELTTREINSGCCGMAGSFGHERDHYDVAKAVCEQRLLPAIRDRGSAEIVVSGFSCREQISHHAQLHPRHVLEVLNDRLVE